MHSTPARVVRVIGGLGLVAYAAALPEERRRRSERESP